MTSNCISHISIGLRLDCEARDPVHGRELAYQLGTLETLVASLIAGDRWEKNDARHELQRLIDKGRRHLQQQAALAAQALPSGAYCEED